MKFAPFVVLVLLLGALIGWFAPGGSEPGAEPVALLAEVQPDTEQAASVGGEVVLARAGDGHFYAEVAIDGVSTPMLVDTGASVVALTGDDADALGIAWNLEDVRPVARGASGPVEGVPVMIEHMQLGDLEGRGIAAVVIPEGLPVSLLGQSFLSQVRVAMEGDRMVLGG
jgi:aspartyl protease family protein